MPSECEGGRPLRVLTVLGQRPSMTGSGVLVTELFQAGVRAGDSQRLICAGYPEDDWLNEFGASCDIVTCGAVSSGTDVPFDVPGMSDAMPYRSTRYRDLSESQVAVFVDAFARRLRLVLHAGFQPEILHINHLWVLAELASQSLAPTFITVHGTDLMQAYVAPVHRERVTRSLPLLRHVFCVSRDMAADARRLYGLPADRVSVVGNGYNDRIFRVTGPRKARVSDRRLVLCAGKFVAWKGFSYAIRACAQLLPGPELVILGDGPDPNRVALVEEARSEGVDVLLPGHVSQSEVAAWMRTADVFLLPSIREPFGLVLLEAIASGCQVVASNEGGPPDIVHQELIRRGLATLVSALRPDEPADVHRYVRDIAEALRGHLDRDIGPTGRSLIAATVAERTWDAVYAEIRDMYCWSLQSGPSAVGT